MTDSDFAVVRHLREELAKQQDEVRFVKQQHRELMLEYLHLRELTREHGGVPSTPHGPGCPGIQAAQGEVIDVA